MLSSILRLMNGNGLCIDSIAKFDGIFILNLALSRDVSVTFPLAFDLRFVSVTNVHVNFLETTEVIIL